MQQTFGRTFPDLIGFVIVGATAGMVLSGGVEGGITIQSVAGSIVGGLLGPACIVMPWSRLFRPLSARNSAPIHS